MPKSALEKSMDFLAIRPHSEAELRQKLSRGEVFSAAEVESAITFCRQRGYLNDALLAADSARFMSNSGKGSRMIRMKLQRRGISGDTLDEAMENSGIDDEESARAAAAVKLRLLVREKDFRKKREKLFRFLIGRGFAPELAGKLTKELSEEESVEEE